MFAHFVASLLDLLINLLKHIIYFVNVLVSKRKNTVVVVVVVIMRCIVIDCSIRTNILQLIMSCCVALFSRHWIQKVIDLLIVDLKERALDSVIVVL